MNENKIAAVIPARMAASRYPGKPLIQIEGLPMIEHVRRRASLCKSFSEVVVATCDHEIYESIQSYGGKAIMTSNQHAMASDRVAEAVKYIDCTHVINIQGDEIIVMPEDIDSMITAMLSNKAGEYWNAVATIEKQVELCDKDIVKCVVSTKGNILYCARDFSNLNLNDAYEPVKKILGILGYTRKSISSFNAMTRTPLETNESIDQSRIIENEYPLYGILFQYGFPGINNKKEEILVRDILNSNEKQKIVLNQILSL